MQEQGIQENSVLNGKLLQDIIEVVHECGKIMLRATDIDRKTHQKEGKGNFVTEYDSRVQKALYAKLLELLPEAVFFGEEDDADNADVKTGYAFIVDPIDGTTNFTRGYNESAICVAVTKDGTPVLGVVYNPYNSETYSAQRGKGAWLNGEPIQVSDRTLQQGLMMIGTTPYEEDLAETTFRVAYAYFRACQDLRRGGSAALDLCFLASGRAEFFFEMKLSPWDYAAASLIIEEAGGFVSDLQGNPLTYDKRQTVSARAKNVELLDLTGIL